MSKEDAFTYEDYRSVIDRFAPCMNDYLYVVDIKNDRYYITKRALGRFALPGEEFEGVLEGHRKFVYPEDLPLLEADLDLLLRGKKDSHDIIYRWIGVEKEPIWINCKGRVIRDDEGAVAFMVGCINEVGKRNIADNISGLMGDHAIWENWEKFVEHMPGGFLLRFGIDDFKAVNEKLGVAYGDRVLRGVARCILDALHPGQEVYRTISDEFVVVDYEGGTLEDARELYQKVRALNDVLIEQSDYEAVYTISGGVVTGADVWSLSAEDIRKISQFALNQAKLMGKNQIYSFQEKDYDAFLRRRAILVELRRAVSHNYAGFELFFQPIIRVGDPQLYAAESLLRFTTTAGERLSPVEFIPILEESGLIIPVGRWIIDQALSMCAESRRTYPDFKISVNLSYVQVLKSSVYDEIVGALERYHLCPDCMIVEMTESGYIENTPTVRKVWDKLRDYGVLIAIDDFGTGYSNLQSISSIMPNIVKLDRGFTMKALQNYYEHQLMTHIIQLVHSIDLKICVEGVETMDELSEIEKLSADCIQGYYYGKPCSRDEFLEDFVRGGKVKEIMEAQQNGGVKALTEALQHSV
ncbi:MAG: EAL domain-containing protein [Muribaculaceae bacterium]|nr:EAL domain-containing protein [Roseburia sp.]MCM1431766.1 EAL domain-containing protein [Muribaculaceae bacterium]MCM1493368.1 EAL domain-containing protein [Muribaculaceae bacterium]